MVVTPGVDNHNSDDSMGDDAGELGTIIDTEDDNDVMNGDGTYGNSMHLDNPSSTNILGAATSGETGANVASKVMAWEDPFEISSTVSYCINICINIRIYATTVLSIYTWPFCKYELFYKSLT
jgi:hypothetical protein